MFKQLDFSKFMGYQGPQWRDVCLQNFFGGWGMAQAPA
jgi:hypothetical protein